MQLNVIAGTGSTQPGLDLHQLDTMNGQGRRGAKPARNITLSPSVAFIGPIRVVHAHGSPANGSRESLPEAATAPYLGLGGLAASPPAA